jgi:hypothetical protein
MGNGPGGGGGAGPSNDQLKIAQQMFALLDQMKARAEKISDAFETQAQATAKMAENFKGMGTGEVVNQLMEVNKTLKDVVAALQNLKTNASAAFSEISEGATEAGTSTQGLSDALDDAGESAASASSDFNQFRDRIVKSGAGVKGLKQQLSAIGDYLGEKFPAATGAALGALSGLQQGFKNLMAAGSGFMGIASSLISSLWDIGKAIISIPFKMFSALIEMANSASGGISELAQAINELRKQFGALSGPTNSAIMSTAKSMGKLSVGGISAMRLFGNLADRVKLMTELMSEGGASMRRFAQEIEDSGGATLALQKGLGISNEHMKGLAHRARASGKGINDTLVGIQKQAEALGKRFGLDAKVISRGMAAAANDMKHFGHMSTKQLGVAVAYAEKLGLELDDIAGTLDQFVTFEDAAEHVSALNAQFGTNIDLEEMMAAESPAEQMAIVQKAMEAQGRSLKDLTYRERMYFKEHAGWTDAQFEAAAATKDSASMLNDMKKESEAAEKKVVSQEEAMSKLADAIDRVFKDGGERPKSFFDALVKGMERGLNQIPAVRALFGNIRKSTDQFTFAGMKLVKMIYENFPGITKIVAGLTDLFDPKRIGGMLDGVINIFKGFFKKLKKGDASFKDMMAELKEEFFNFFRKSGPGADTLMQGFSEFFLGVKVILAGGIEWLLTSVADLVNSVIDAITNPPNLSGVGDAAQNYLSPIGEAFANGWAVLGPALGRLFGVLVDKMGEVVVPKIKEAAIKYWPVIAAVLFGPALAQAFLGAGTALIAGAVGGAIKKAVSGPDVMDDVAKALKNLNQNINRLPPTPPPTPPIPAPPPSAAAAQAGAAINWKLVLMFLVGFAMVIAIGLVAFYIAAEMVEDMSIETVGKALAVILAVSISAVPVAIALNTLAALPPVNVPALLPALGALALAMLGLSALGIIVATAASGLDAAAVAKGTLMVIGMAIAAAIVALSLPPILPAAGAVADGGVTLLIALVALGLVTYGLIKLGEIVVESAQRFQAADIAKGILLVIGMAAAAAAIGASLILLVAGGIAAVLGMGFIIAALGAMGLVVVGLGELADLTVSTFAGMNVEQVKKAGDVIVQAAKIVGVAALAVVALALTGGLMLLGGGLGAAAYLVGFATVSDILGDKDSGLVGLSMAISKEVANMPKDIGPKAEAFAKILEAVAKVMQVIPDTLESMDFGFFESSSDQATKINKTTEMITALIGQSGSGKGVIGIIEAIIAQISALPMSSIKKAEAIGPVLQGAAGIATALGSSSSLSDAFKNIDDDDFEKLVPIIDKMGELTKNIGSSIKDVLSGLIPVIEAAKGIKGKDAEGIKAVAALMSAIGPIAQALAPPPEAMSMLSKLAEKDNDEVAGAIEGLSGYVDTVGKVLSRPGGIIDGIKGTIVSIIGALKGLSISESSAKALEAIGPIISTIVQFVSSMAKPQQESNTTEVKNSLTGGNKFKENLDNISKFIGDVLSKMSEHIPKLISGIAGGLASAMSQLKPEQVALFEPLGKIIESLIKLVTSLIPPPSTPPPPPKEALEKGGTIIYNISNSAPDIGGMLTALGQSIPQLVDIIVKEAQKVGKIRGIEKELDLLLKLFDILPKLASIIDATKNFENEEGKADPKIVDTIVEKVGLMKTFLSRILSGPIPEIISTIQTAIPNLKGLDKADKAADDIAKGFSSLKKLMSSIKDVIASLTEKDAEGAEVSISETTRLIANKVSDISIFLQSIEGSIGPLLTSQDKLAKMLSSSPGGDISSISERVIGAGEMFHELMNSELLKGAEGSIKHVDRLKDLIGKGIVPSVKAAEDMIKMAKKLEEAMGQGLKIDLDANLSKFAAKFGKIGDAGAYKVTARDVIINVSFKVTMDSAPIERIMITNGSSVIRNRMNLLIDATKEGSDGDGPRTTLQNSGKIQPNSSPSVL